jgi:hypothetical protein
MTPDFARTTPLAMAAKTEEERSMAWKRQSITAHLAERKPAELLIDSYPDNAGLIISTRVLLPPADAQDFECNDADADALRLPRRSKAQSK